MWGSLFTLCTSFFSSTRNILYVVLGSVLIVCVGYFYISYTNLKENNVLLERQYNNAVQDLKDQNILNQHNIEEFNKERQELKAQIKINNERANERIKQVQQLQSDIDSLKGIEIDEKEPVNPYLLGVFSILQSKDRSNNSD